MKEITMYKNALSLHNQDGQRKYLNQKERLQFLEVAKRQTIEIRLFCLLLYYTGARIAEIHKLHPKSIDLSNGTVVIESLKKRQSGIYREIPLPQFLLEELGAYSKQRHTQTETLLWSFSLRTASRQIKRVMEMAEINGVRGCAKGLRHGFAVHAVTIAPLTLVKKWLGHSTLETTEIYLNIVGKEEREIASRIW